MVEWPPIASSSDVPDAFGQLPNCVAYLNTLIVEAANTYAGPPRLIAGMIPAGPMDLIRVRDDVVALVRAVDSAPRADLVTGETPHELEQPLTPADPGAVRMTATDAAWAFWSTFNAIQLLRNRRSEGRGENRATRRALTAHLNEVNLPDLLIFGWEGDPLLQEPHRPVGPAYRAAVRGHQAALAAYEPPPLIQPSPPPKGPSWH